MKNLIRSLYFVLLFITFYYSSYCQTPTGQGSIFFDFVGQDYDFVTVGLVPTNDSLYMLTQGNGVDTVGLLLSFAKDGSDYNVIKTFNGDLFTPTSLLGNDTILYGSAYLKKDLNTIVAAMFKYDINVGQIEIVKEFTKSEAFKMEIVHITDSILWGLSDNSLDDEGSIFTIKPDGSDFKKIYNNTNSDLGQNPVDIEIVDNQIYIAFQNGGGIPYPDGFGSELMSGSVVRINLDGTGYTKILTGEDLIGTNPRNIIRNGEDIYVYFTKRGSEDGASIFKFKTDGSGIQKVIDLDRTGRGDLLLKDNNLLLGITTHELFQYDLTTNIRSSLISFNDLSSFDGDYGPVILGEDIIATTNQGGANGGGGIIAKYDYTPEILSIDSGISDRIYFYPNPTENELSIDLGTISGDINIKIFDLSGNEQSFQTSKGTNGELILKLDLLGPGIYMLNVKSEEETITSRLIKR